MMKHYYLMIFYYKQFVTNTAQVSDIWYDKNSILSHGHPLLKKITFRQTRTTRQFRVIQISFVKVSQLILYYHLRTNAASFCR
jgi:hypothetical protein